MGSRSGMRRILSVLAAGLSLGGCHRAPPKAAAAPVALTEDHCWWAVYRAAQPVDTVAARFGRAFGAVGLAPVRAFRLGDTVRVDAGPSPLASADGRVVGARLVAYQAGDSTHFRTYVSMRDSAGSVTIPLCGRISGAAAVGAIAPREPDGEEKLPVWAPRY